MPAALQAALTAMPCFSRPKVYRSSSRVPASITLGQAHLLHCLENHGERMHAAEARAQGLPIGSGNVEANCKSLVALRMKRPGARWKNQPSPAAMPRPAPGS